MTEAITAATEAAASHSPQQQEIPFARVRGQPFFEPPKDLYIPPDALEVILDAFEGPLDLLLYLIRRQNLEILDIHLCPQWQNSGRNQKEMGRITGGSLYR